MTINIFHVLSSACLIGLASCNEEDKTTDSSSSSNGAEKTSQNTNPSTTEKAKTTSTSSTSEWDKITESTIDKVLTEEQVRKLFNIEGEVKKKSSASNVYGETLSFRWESKRPYLINGKTVTKKQMNDVVVYSKKSYGNNTPEKAKTNFNFGYKVSSPEAMKEAIELKRNNGTPSEVDILMEDGLTAEENKCMMEILKEKNAAGATGLQEPRKKIEPTHEAIDDNTRWNIGNESLSILSGTEILEIRVNVSHKNEISKKAALDTLELVLANLKKLP